MQRFKSSKTCTLHYVLLLPWERDDRITTQSIFKLPANPLPYLLACGLTRPNIWISCPFINWPLIDETYGSGCHFGTKITWFSWALIRQSNNFDGNYWTRCVEPMPPKRRQIRIRLQSFEFQRPHLDVTPDLKGVSCWRLNFVWKFAMQQSIYCYLNEWNNDLFNYFHLLTFTMNRSWVHLISR